MGAVGPWLVDASPIEQNLRNQLAHPGAAHWLGTDVLGRSWLARLAHATQLSLGMAVLAALSAAVPGTLLGVLAAWRGGRVERTLVMLADAVLAIPGLLLVLLIAALAPASCGRCMWAWPLPCGWNTFRVCRAMARARAGG